MGVLHKSISKVVRRIIEGEVVSKEDCGRREGRFTGMVNEVFLRGIPEPSRDLNQIFFSIWASCAEKCRQFACLWHFSD